MGNSLHALAQMRAINGLQTGWGWLGDSHYSHPGGLTIFSCLSAGRVGPLSPVVPDGCVWCLQVPWQ